MALSDETTRKPGSDGASPCLGQTSGRSLTIVLDRGISPYYFELRTLPPHITSLRKHCSTTAYSDEKDPVLFDRCFPVCLRDVAHCFACSMATQNWLPSSPTRPNPGWQNQSVGGHWSLVADA